MNRGDLGERNLRKARENRIADDLWRVYIHYMIWLYLNLIKWPRQMASGTDSLMKLFILFGGTPIHTLFSDLQLRFLHISLLSFSDCVKDFKISPYVCIYS